MLFLQLTVYGAMETLHSVIVTPVLKMKEIVILMISVKKLSHVDLIIVQIYLALTQKQIVVMIIHNQLLEMKHFALPQILVSKPKGIVIHMMSVKIVLHVVLIIVQTLQGLNQEQIVVVAVILIQIVSIMLLWASAQVLMKRSCLLTAEKPVIYVLKVHYVIVILLHKKSKI